MKVIDVHAHIVFEETLNFLDKELEILEEIDLQYRGKNCSFLN